MPMLCKKAFNAVIASGGNLAMFASKSGVFPSWFLIGPSPVNNQP